MLTSARSRSPTRACSSTSTSCRGSIVTNGCMAASGSALNWIVPPASPQAEAVEAARAAGQSASRAGSTARAEAICPRAPADSCSCPTSSARRRRSTTPRRERHPRRPRVSTTSLPHVWRVRPRSGRVSASATTWTSSPRWDLRPAPRAGLRRRRGERSSGSRLRPMSSSGRYERLLAASRLQSRRGLRRRHGHRSALDDWSAIGSYARCDRVFEPDGNRTGAYRDAYGIYRDLYRRLETLYPALADLPTA